MNSDGSTALHDNEESMQNYKDIFVENVNKGDGERYREYRWKRQKMMIINVFNKHH